VPWRRIPPQLILTFVFGVIGLVFAAVIVLETFAALGVANVTLGYSATEMQGIRYLSRTQDVLNRLVAYRNASAAKNVGARVLGDGGQRVALAELTAAIARIPDQLPVKTKLDADIDGDLLAVQKHWTTTSRNARISPVDLEAAVVAAQALIVAIQTRSGIANDPSTDAINFGDALVRFPISSDDGSGAASLALANLALANVALPPRFTAARLLARAQIAVDVGLQDAEDEAQVDPTAAAPLIVQSTANEVAFKAVRNRITKSYVDVPPRKAFVDRALVRNLADFSASSIAVIDLFRANLLRVVSNRIDRTREQRRQFIVEAIVKLCFEAFVLFALARICVVSYRNAGKRIAERAVVEARRAELESQLMHAHAQQELLRAKGQFRAVFDHAPTGMIIVDPDCRIVEANDAAQAIFAAAPQPSAINVIGDHAKIVAGIFEGTIDLHSADRHYVDGVSSRWLHISIAPVHAESGGAVFAVLMLRDITDNKSLETQLKYEATHDALTGLLNRQAFLGLLQQTLDRRSASDVFSVVFIDFNDFKAINDGFGHAAGDRFLIEGTARLRNALRSTDVIARIGGDEFAVLLLGSDRAGIENSVLRLQSALAVPVNIEGQLVASSASFGIAQAEPQYVLGSELICDADTAMYHAKSQGGRNVVVFEQSMRENAVRRMQVSIDLVGALENNELQLLYQPIVDLGNGTLAGCEALLRWPQPDGSFISPAEFIPLAEQSGLILAIGEWVMTTACRQVHAWNELVHQRALDLPPGFVVHINLAAAEVHDVDLSAKIQKRIGGLSVRPDQLMLEITEGNVLKSTRHVRSTLDRLTDDGFRLCIDDFGTGYSSLRYLNDLPLHSFKVDRSFVSNGGEGLANASIVDMLMVLSRSLGLHVVAEGIETPTQWQQLRELGCAYGQGYLFAPAVDGATLTRMLDMNLTFDLRGLTGSAVPVLSRDWRFRDVQLLDFPDTAEACLFPP
jgi:diguanylate cyclase (GGDEF)-like protein